MLMIVDEKWGHCIHEMRVVVEVVHGDEYDNGRSHLSNVVSLIFILYVVL